MVRLVYSWLFAGYELCNLCRMMYAVNDRVWWGADEKWCDRCVLGDLNYWVDGVTERDGNNKLRQLCKSGKLVPKKHE